MSSRNIRVLVVDDSPLVREIISDVIKEAPGIELAGTACDGRQALLQLERLKPDVITLDVQMPNMDGLATLDAILASNPVPVVMVSSLTQLGANTTLEALDRGALDYVAKPEGAAGVESVLRDELMRKILAMAGTDVRRMLQIRKERAARASVIRHRQVEVSPPTSAGEVADFVDACIALGISRPAGRRRCLRCSRNCDLRCRRSSSCSTCLQPSPSRLPGGSTRSVSLRSRKPKRATCSSLTTYSWPPADVICTCDARRARS